MPPFGTQRNNHVAPIDENIEQAGFTARPQKAHPKCDAILTEHLRIRWNGGRKKCAGSANSELEPKIEPVLFCL